MISVGIPVPYFVAMPAATATAVEESSYSMFCNKEILYFGFLCCTTIAVLVTQVGGWASCSC